MKNDNHKCKRQENWLARVLVSALVSFLATLLTLWCWGII